MSQATFTASVLDEANFDESAAQPAIFGDSVVLLRGLMIPVILSETFMLVTVS